MFWVKSAHQALCHRNSDGRAKRFWIRAEVDDRGKFDTYQVATVPGAAVEDYPIEKLLRQAVEDGAWD